MRIRLRFLLALIVVILLARTSATHDWDGLFDRFESGTAREPVTLSHTYLLHDSRWLEFDLPPSEFVWVLTNANFPASSVTSDASQSLQPGAIYALDYEFLGSRDEVLQTGDYHFRCQPPNPQEAARPQAFYSADGLLPGASQSMRQRFASLQARPSRLRLRLKGHEPGIQDVAVRIYCQDDIPEYKLANAWRRSNRRKRERLCKASVYGPELLTEYQRRNLFKKKWLPIAPIGVEGRDYARRILYSLISERVDQSIQTELPAGLQVNSDTVGIIPLPTGPGTVRLEFARIMGETTQSDPIEIGWFGSRVTQRDQWQFHVDADSTAFTADVDGGLLEIVSTEPFSIRADWRGESNEASREFEDITPEPNSVRAYLVDAQRPVEFEIEHVQGQPTPLRLAFRKMLPCNDAKAMPETDPLPVRINWSYLGDQGQVVRAGYLETHEALSRYDRASQANMPMRVTDAAIRSFAVPAGVRTVCVCSPDAGVLVNASSRPPDVASITYVPDDYSAFHRRQGWRQSWFLLRPVDSQQRVNQLQTAIIQTQTRPREVDAQRLAGEYQWTSLTPSGRWKGRHVLLPREPGLPLHWEAQSTAFYELQTNVSHDLQLLAEPGHNWVAPRLVCQTDAALPISIRVYANDTLHQELRLRSRMAELDLEPLPAPPNQTTRLRIEVGGAVRVLMNRLEQTAETVYFKRLVTRLEAGALTFEYTKQQAAEELLGVTLFAAPTDQRPRLHVNIAGDMQRVPGPAADWTLLDRVYELRPAASQAIPTFATAEPHVFEQHQCYVRLGADLPPATYTIRVTREDARTGYLLLSKTTSGLSARRELGNESIPYSDSRKKQLWQAMELPR